MALHTVCNIVKSGVRLCLECRQVIVFMAEDGRIHEKKRPERMLSPIPEILRFLPREDPCLANKMLGVVGMTGLEPATTGPPDQHSKPTELHPDLANAKVRHKSEMCKFARAFFQKNNNFGENHKKSCFSPLFFTTFVVKTES